MKTAPAPWPYGRLEEWQAWRASLDGLKLPNVQSLRDEADHELARIARCMSEAAVVRRPPLVPPHIGERGSDEEPNPSQDPVRTDRGG
jgi:hypothetical protein